MHQGAHRLLEEGYLLPDPFSLSRTPLLVGARCSLCDKDVCASPKCSLFYCRRFCGACVRANQQHFPPKVLAAEKQLMAQPTRAP